MNPAQIVVLELNRESEVQILPFVMRFVRQPRMTAYLDWDCESSVCANMRPAGTIMEILKGYFVKIRGQQKWQDAELQDELFALFKLAWLENARLLAKRNGQNYYFMASFLNEEEAARFTENFASHERTTPLLKTFAVADEKGFVPWGQVVPKDVGDRLTIRLAADDDLADASIASMIERDRQDPDEDYLLTVSEETKERWLERKRQQEKRKI